MTNLSVLLMYLLKTERKFGYSKLKSNLVQFRTIYEQKLLSKLSQFRQKISQNSWMNTLIILQIDRHNESPRDMLTLDMTIYFPVISIYFRISRINWNTTICHWWFLIWSLGKCLSGAQQPTGIFTIITVSK